MCLFNERPNYSIILVLFLTLCDVLIIYLFSLTMFIIHTLIVNKLLRLNPSTWWKLDKNPLYSPSIILIISTPEIHSINLTADRRSEKINIPSSTYHLSKPSPKTSIQFYRYQTDIFLPATRTVYCHRNQTFLPTPRGALSGCRVLIGHFRDWRYRWIKKTAPETQ